MSKEERVSSSLVEMKRRQLLLERRQQRLLRRLRRVSARGLGASVSGQLRELLAYGAKELAPPSNDPPLLTELQPDSMKGMSTTDLISLVRRMEGRATPRPPPALTPHVRQEVGVVAAEMGAAAHGHAYHDSDATESSSGGESCDENDGYTSRNTAHTPM